ncbi:hypothetical protein [Brevundimonas sp.]|uniref:hypothetical protein n=1 Tax=Brevundimonas sp. TaxID=1871086 RepID=UPI003F71AB4F
MTNTAVQRLLTVLGASAAPLTRIAPSVAAPFPVRTWRAPEVVWLNRRWLAEKGVLDGAEDEGALKIWLADRYAVTVMGGVEPETCFSPAPARVMWADRYGDTWGSSHGGSGRCGMLHDGLNAKGVGRTPLVAPDVDWYHSHGFMWLEEAIREAICSEVVDQTFPFGATPTLAVIDTGDRIHWGDGNLGERRAVLVRPNAFRLGHLLRSVFFGGGGQGSPQLVDEARVRALVAHLDGGTPDGLSGLLVLSARHLGTQIGFAAASRLWPGPVHASNLTLSGAILDFGSFRSLPDWSDARATEKEPSSRQDMEQLRLALSAAARAATKRGVVVRPEDLHAPASLGFEAGFERYFRDRLDPKGLSNRPVWSDLMTALRRAYEGFRSALAHDLSDQNGPVAALGLSPNADLDKRFSVLAASLGDTDARHLIRLGQRLQSPALLVRESLLAETQALLETQPNKAIGAFIDDRVRTALPLPDLTFSPAV